MSAYSGGTPPIDYRRIVGMDPGAQWLLGPGFKFFAPPGENDPVIPFMFIARDEAAVRAVQALRSARFVDDTGEPAIVILGPDQDLDRGLESGTVYSARALRAVFDRAATAQEGPFAVFGASRKRIKLGLPLPAPPQQSRLTERSEALARARTEPCRPKTVVLGVIDDAIAFANARFRRSDNTTRFQAFWIQDNIDGGTPPIIGGVSTYGSELTKANINQLITDCLHGDWFDEDELYRRCGLADFTNSLHKGTAWRIAHGTHVLDLAGGFDMDEDRADRPIIGVQLPVASTATQSGTGLETYVLDAITYITSRAAALVTESGAPVPVVINFSYATHDGPHDGTSVLERGIDGAITSGNPGPGRAALQIVLPAGNTEQSRCHAEVAFTTSDEVELFMRVEPDNLDPSTVQIWLPCVPAGGLTKSRVCLSVVSPAGVTSGPLKEEVSSQIELKQNGANCGLGVYSPASETGTTAADVGDRAVFRIDIYPTAQSPDAATDPTDVLAPSGVWTIRLKNESLSADDKIEAWIDRDDLLYGYPRRGRQAYFDDKTYRRFDREGRPLDDDPTTPNSVVRRAGMINAIGTGQKAVVVGGYRRRDLTEADYSAGGPITVACNSEPDKGCKPDALVVSDDSRVHTGLLAAGTRGGSVVALSGTSMACARLTRWCVEQLAAGVFPDRAAVETLAEAGEAGLPAGKPKLPPDRGGCGRVVFSEATPLWKVRFWNNS
jgi:hypothetical protein